MTKINYKLIKALRQLGFTKLWCFARYQVGLRSGHYRRATPSRREGDVGIPGLAPLEHFPQVSQEEINSTLIVADEICRGRVRLFGGEPVPLILEAGASGEHWTVLERTPLKGGHQAHLGTCPVWLGDHPGQGVCL